MSEVKLLILPSVVKARTTLHTNVDDKLIIPEIKAAQDMYVRPLLGSALFAKLLSDSPTYSDHYLTLVDDYLIDVIINYVLAGMPETLGYQFYNKGVATKQADQSQSPSMSDMYSLIDKYKSRAEHYAQLTRKYLIRYASERYPEYYAAGGIDSVTPESNSYHCPIPLDEPIRSFGRANHNPNYNSNDPYPID